MSRSEKAHEKNLTHYVFQLPGGRQLAIYKLSREVEPEQPETNPAGGKSQN